MARRWVVVCAAVGVVAAGAYFVWRARTAPALGPRDAVLVADFENTTGDEVFDGSLRQGVVLSLEQTPFLSLLPDQRMLRTLRAMQRPPNEPIKGPVARELCQRAGAAVAIEGSIASRGTSYDVRLDARHCKTGTALATASAHAAAKDNVLEALDAAAAALRRQLGEPAASVQQRNLPLGAFTSSLPALRALGDGTRARFTRGDQASVPFYLQAASLDPTCAIAYAKLGVVAGNLGRLGEAKAYAQKAFDLKDRASEYERLLILWNYAMRVASDPAQSRAALAQLTTTFPRDFAARNNFGVYYMSRGQFEEALTQYQAAIDIAADEPVPLSNSAYALFFLGRRDDAYKMVDRAFAIRPDAGLALTRWTSALIAGDSRAAQFETAAQALANPQQFSQVRATLALYRGRLAEYHRIEDSLRVEARAIKNDVMLAWIDAAEQRALAVFEGGAHLQALRESMTKPLPPDALAQSAALLGSLGAMDAVRPALPKLQAAAGQDSTAAIPARVARDYVQAADGHGPEAVADLESLLNQFPQQVELNFHIGTIRERLGDLKGAEKSYRAVLASANALGLNPSIATTRVALGMMLVRAGNTAGAREQFDELIKQWKDADGQFALLKKVRQERAKIG